MTKIYLVRFLAIPGLLILILFGTDLILHTSGQNPPTCPPVLVAIPVNNQ